MTVFFPFGIPTTSSFANSAQTALTIDAPPGYTAPYADRAVYGPPGSPGINATNCPSGYENALNPSNPGSFPPVPSQPIDRSGYLLCFPTASLPPSPSPSFVVSPSPSLAVCNSLGTFSRINSLPGDPSNCSIYIDGSVQLYSTNCSDLTSPIGCIIYTIGCTTNAYDSGIRAFNDGTYYVLNSSSQISSTGACTT